LWFYLDRKGDPFITYYLNGELSAWLSKEEMEELEVQNYRVIPKKVADPLLGEEVE